jgi:hypothetical protein
MREEAVELKILLKSRSEPSDEIDKETRQMIVKEQCMIQKILSSHVICRLPVQT